MRTTVALMIAAGTGLAFAAPRPLDLRRVSLDLPGAPAAIVPADLDRDGRADLVVVVPFTTWGSISTDRVEKAVMVTEVVPALFDRREARAFLARPDGGYAAVPPLKLPSSVIAVAAGTGAHPVLALTDDGIEEIRWSAEARGPGTLALAPLLSEPSAYAGTAAFLPDLGFARDVDGDGRPDAVLATPDGLAIHRGAADGSCALEASFRGALPDDRTFETAGRAFRRFPVPSFEDVDGDGVPDLVARELDETTPRVAIAKGEGRGRFGAARWVSLACLLPPASRADREGERGASSGPSPGVPYFGDLDGDGRAEIVSREGIDTGKSELKQARKPKMRYRVYHLRPDLTVDPAPAQTFDATGYAFSGRFADGADLEFLDLDGDGRKDLVTITLDFSIFQALRALTAKKIGIGLDFHVLAQQPDGSFRAVAGDRLHEKLKLDLNRLEISRLGQFQGDFDGDGRIDFVHLGRGRTVTIHRGAPGCLYPDKPDLAIRLAEAPEDVLLVRVRDLDGDGRSDLAITRTHEAAEEGVTAPVTLELYLSGRTR